MEIFIKYDLFFYSSYFFITKVLVLKWDPFSFVKGAISGDSEDLRLFLAHTDVKEDQIVRSTFLISLRLLFTFCYRCYSHL